MKEGTELFKTNTSKWGSALSLIYYGNFLSSVKDLENALKYFKRGLELSAETENKHLIMLGLIAVAENSVINNKFEKAAKLLCVSEELKKITKYFYTVCESERIKKITNTVNENLKPGITESINNISLSEAVNLAME